MEDFCRTYITYARQLSSQGLYNKAFDFYLMAFDQCSERKPFFESEFRVVLVRLNELLQTYGKIEEIFSNFGKAISAFPGNMYLLNDIGKYLFKYGYYSMAWCHFQKAINVDSGYVDAEKNLNSVKNLLVERWHFRMLNDRIRNEAYHAAILETVIPGKDSVLDVGTGTGLLALYANECAPLATTGCEGSDVMAKLAEVILQENSVHDIVIVNKMSTNMDATELGGRKSLIITEMFDSGLLGEQVLQSLSHAYNNLMGHCGRVLPCYAEFFVVAAKCDRLNMKYQLQSSAKELLNIPGLTIHTLTYGETYDCEDVHLFKDIKYRTDIQSLLKINFNNYDDIKGKLQQSEPFDIKWTVKEGGEINIVVGWFNLHLTEKIMITTNPTSECRANAWQQAVFFNFIPRNAHENETLDAQFRVNGGKMTLVSDGSVHISRISPETIRFLNDYEYTKKITDCIGAACDYLGQNIEISQVDIVDACPFPLFGLLMMKRGARSLVCCAKTASDKKFFKKVFKANNMPLSKISFFVGNRWTPHSLGKTKYHAIFCHTFELCGDIDLRQREIAQNLKQKNLHQEGLYLPANVHLIGQLVSSQWLDINNRVYDENVANYKIAMHMNKFQVSQNYCIDFTNLDYFEISSPIVIGTLTSEMESDVINDVPIINDGNANAILCWYSIELVKDSGEIQTNRSDSFIDGMAFLAHPALPMVQGGFANVLRCVDFDGSFKLMVDTDAT